MAFKDLIEAARRRLEGRPAAAIPKHARHENIHLSNPWHSVAIEPGAKRCQAVNALAGHRFLSKDAPRLPLPGCTEPACSCRYRHFDDRRDEDTGVDHNGVPVPHAKRRNTD